MAERGERSARAAQVATLETRRAKDYDVPVHRLRAEWRARAEEHRLDRQAVEWVLGWPRELESCAGYPVEGERLVDELLSAGGLTHEHSTFTRRDVVQALSEAAR